jgi:hypothetical protein
MDTALNSMMEWANQFRIKQYELSFQFIQHMITLSTILIGLSITFTKDIIKNAEGRASQLLKAAWAAFLFSILWGLTAMAALLLVHFDAKVEAGTFSSRIDSYALLPAFLQFLTFILGVVLMIVSGALALRNAQANKAEAVQQ